MALHSSMAEALRLTRSGNLAEATALLRSALSGGVSGAAPPAPGRGGETISGLLPEPALARMRESVGRERPETVEAKGTFDERTYRGREGVMSYLLYRPDQFRQGMPLIVLLHGCTQSPEDFARGTGMNRLAEELGFMVAYPRQTQAANPQKCWNWFKPADQQRDRGEPALLAAMTRQVIAEHAADPDRVYVAGLSAGGAAAAIMAAAYPDIYAAVGVHSGLPCGAAKDLPSALAAMKGGGRTSRAKGRNARFVPVITFHGDRDGTVDQSNSREIIAAATAAAGVPLQVRREQGRSGTGRSYSREISVDPAGTVLLEHWSVSGSGHAWSGGDSSGSYTDPSGPDASREMARFFLERKRS
ncbi:PHB depolymerase family esterase [Novosphingobium sp. RD2P27]|uniref:PHB depolymerase family esterase n=1 Tax=Novosphingobium kalidii TaxID=3230299 RepID=A0ABV2D5K7_9SPHN